MITIAKTFRFEAAHILPRHPGHCSRLHGHSWELTVGVTGGVDPASGFVMDFGDLKQIVQEEIVAPLDHQFLGAGECIHTFEGYSRATNVHELLPNNFYPTSENLVKLFAEILATRLRDIDRQAGQSEIKLAYVKLNETCTSEAIWTPK